MHPDTAAIIVIKTKIPDFVDFATLEFDCFLHYYIHDDGQTNELQNFAGRIEINTDIFHDKKFLVTFDKDNGKKCKLTVLLLILMKMGQEVAQNRDNLGYFYVFCETFIFA